MHSSHHPITTQLNVSPYWQPGVLTPDIWASWHLVPFCCEVSWPGSSSHTGWHEGPLGSAWPSEVQAHHRCSEPHLLTPPALKPILLWPEGLPVSQATLRREKGLGKWSEPVAGFQGVRAGDEPLPSSKLTGVERWPENPHPLLMLPQMGCAISLPQKQSSRQKRLGCPYSPSL